MRNKENIDKVIAEITNEKNYFSMESFFEEYGESTSRLKSKTTNWCGTPSCIAGWASWIASGGEIPTNFSHDADIDWAKQTAANFLGVDEHTAFNLFYASDSNGTAHILKVSREEAIKTLEVFRDTGTVDWSHAASYGRYGGASRYESE